MSIKTKKALLNVFKWAVLLIIMFFLLFPIYWVVLTSFKTNMESYLYPPTFLPKVPTLEGFINLFTNYPEFFIYYKNNIIVSALSTILVCMVALFSGYALGSDQLEQVCHRFPAVLPDVPRGIPSDFPVRSAAGLGTA